MSKVIITCDRAGDRARAAVWRGKELCDLYVDRIASPDFSGAVLRGKIVRTLAGQKAAWVDCGLHEKVYIETTTPLKTGAYITVRVASVMREGKAWRGAIQKDEKSENTAGILVPPPAPWVRALAGLKEDDKALLRFAGSEDCELFHMANKDPRFEAELVYKDPVHAGLDEVIDGLLETRVSLSGGASLMIERTHALIAIDVNGGESTNPAAVNLIAVREAARQIRLRNLAGLIVIDCLKMKARPDISKVVNAFSRVAQDDPAGIQFIGMSKLGLLECTRTRKGPALMDVMGQV